MIEKNKTYKCTVTDLTVNGDGIAKIDGYPLFVKGALAGDEILAMSTKLNKTYGFGVVSKLLTPSPDRRKPKCKSFPECGGCSLMHLNYDAQLSYKAELVRSNIRKIGGISDEAYLFEDIIGAKNEYNYRNKAQFPVSRSKGRAVCGFYEQKSHNVISCESCHIQNKAINEAVRLTMEYINANRISAYDEESHKGTVRHIYVRYSSENKELMLCLVTNSSKALKNIDALADALKPLGLVSLIQNVNNKNTNVILGDKNITLWGRDYILMKTDSLVFKVSPHSFFQVNTEQMKRLYAKAIEYASLTGEETVFDLYCGVGSISLFMAEKAKKVIGVEIVPSAIENAKENAVLSGIDNAEFYCGDCTQIVEKLMASGENSDVAVVDPPRKGCDERLLELIGSISPKRLVYVSCNSATLARDIAVLKNFGYKLQKCTAVDLFPQSVHIECVALLSHMDD